MKKGTIYILLAFVVFLTSCCDKDNKSITISNPTSVHFSHLSSASGISIYNKSIYVVGDDTPWLYELDSELNIINRTQISGIDSIFKGRTPKHLKADFEGAEIISDDNKQSICIISSGSVKHTRDTAYLIDIPVSGNIYKKNLRSLYEEIKIKSNLAETAEINMEAIAFSNDHAFLLHRGNVSENFIVEIKRDAFLNFIKGNKILPDFNIYHFNLPVYNGVSSGFSGVCFNQDKSELIFTASMEDTSDEVNDGEILGSYVGIIPLSGLAKGEYFAELLFDNNQLLTKKLEGISVKSMSDNGSINVVTVCDNDDGSSDFITFNITTQ